MRRYDKELSRAEQSKEKSSKQQKSKHAVGLFLNLRHGSLGMVDQ